MMESKSRQDAVREFIRNYARCHTSASSDETTHGALLKLIPMLVMSVLEIQFLSKYLFRFEVLATTLKH